jgi:hypothetical protein
MNSSRQLLASIILALGLLFALAVSTATAGSMGNGWAQRQKLVVDSVDVSAGTIVLKSGVDQTTHTYKVDAATRIIIGRAKGTINQLQTGMKVENLSAIAGAAGVNQTLSMIAVIPAAAAPVPPAPAPPNP